LVYLVLSIHRTYEVCHGSGTQNDLGRLFYICRYNDVLRVASTGTTLVVALIVRGIVWSLLGYYGGDHEVMRGNVVRSRRDRNVTNDMLRVWMYNMN